MGCCGDEDDEEPQTFPQSSASPSSDMAPPSSFADLAISPMNSHFTALNCRDTLRLIFERLPIPDLARASCVCRVWNSVASDGDMLTRAFRAPWRMKAVVGAPSSGSFWRDNSIGKFAISHRIVRGDTVASLAVKYSVQETIDFDASGALAQFAC
ncbi:hypothetical protein CRG98_028092 [Punica granatum]|uniref:F-box domain-containing protein n=1 Tax=Punica granatum TaxID=22663 RepID=A0A2I0J5M4_PUNGR|nr:hypothetical protein CRG98_028092 [Punica granatum]